MFWPTLQRRSLVPLLLLSSLILSVVLSACGDQGGTHITLHLAGWQSGSEADNYRTLNTLFTKAYPNITVQYDDTPFASYATKLQAGFGSGSGADLIALQPGSFTEPFADNGNLLNLAQEPWVSRMIPSAKAAAGSSANPQAVWGMPTGTGAGSVIYNTHIFAQLGLQVPTNWNDFLQICAKIKAAGITPLAMGGKDGWPIEVTAQFMADQTVYRTDPTFDKEVAAGTASYAASPEWKQVLVDLHSLQTNGYLGTSVNGTDFNAASAQMAAGKAAMEIMWSFGVASITTSNPTITLSTFPVPYVQAGQIPLVSTGIGNLLGVNAKSKHGTEAKEYLQFLSRPDIMGPYDARSVSFSVFTDVTPNLNATFQPIVQAIKTNSSPHVSGVIGGTQSSESGFWKDAQNLFNGSETSDQVLQNLDKNRKG